MDEKSMATQLHTPIIIVGNITAGGTGKTPMVRFLMRYITAMGFKVGVISRGHGGSYTGVHHLQAGDKASLVGDEMAMQYAYAQRQGLTNVEFVVCKERIQAALKAQELGVDFIISDDGMQHYRLPRHIEIAVIGKRGLGNELFIPAGPLREDPTRLKTVDYIVNNSQDTALGGYKMEQLNLGFLPLREISTPSNPAKLLHILANWQNWLLDSGYEDQYNDLLSAYLDEQALETKYAKHLLAPDDLTHLKDKDNHSAKAWNVPKVTLHDSLETSALTPELQQAANDSLDRIYSQHQTTTSIRSTVEHKVNVEHTANTEVKADSIDESIVESNTNEQVTTTESNLEQQHTDQAFPRYSFNPQASASNSEQNSEQNATVSTEQSTTASPEQNATATSVSQTKTNERFDVTSTVQNAGFGIFNDDKDKDKVQVKTAPLFDNSDQFMEFINKQLDANVLSTEDLLKRTKAFLAESNILTEQMAATFPKVIALCAIGYPQDFKQTLEGLGFEVVEFFTFKDHHNFSQSDIDKIYKKYPEYKTLPLLVTEKDAIKLKDLDMPDNCFFLEREGFFSRYLSWLDSLKERLIKVYTGSK